MNRAIAEQMLCNVLHSDENLRKEAERAIKSLIQTDFILFLNIFGEILIDNSVQIRMRHICSIVMKNTFYSTDQNTLAKYDRNWMSCPEEFRRNFRNVMEANLSCQERQICQNISKIVGSIARIEMNSGTDRTFFKRMYDLIPMQEYAIGVLDAVTTGCYQLYNDTGYSFKNDYELVLKLSVYYMAQECSKGLAIAFLKCVNESLYILEPIFSDNIANELLVKLCSFVNTDTEVVEMYLQVLNKFIEINHEKIRDKFDIICEFYNRFLYTDQEYAIIHVFDFYSTIAELKYDAIIKTNFNVILPKLFLCLTKEDITDSEWTEHKAASTLLTSLTDDYSISILSQEITKNFIDSHLRSADPEERAVGAVALASVCEKGFERYIREHLPTLTSDIGNDECENEALYAISRICEKDLGVCVGFLPIIIEKCNLVISGRKQSSKNAIWVYFYIFSTLRATSIPGADAVVRYHYLNIIKLLIEELEKASPEDHGLRSAINSTLPEMIVLCPQEMINILENLMNYIIGKINETVVYMESANRDQRLIIEDFLSNYIVHLEACAERMASFPLDLISSTFVSCLKAPENTSYGEVYIALSKLLKKISPNIRTFVPFVLRDISSRDVFIIKSALNFLSDIAFELETDFAQYTPNAIPALINTISSANTPLDLKPRVISVFGDVALAIGNYFEPYVEMALVLFAQIISLNRDDDPEYVDSLRKAVLALFSCIFLSVGDCGEIRKNLSQILDLIKKAILEDKTGAYRAESVNILSDIKKTCGVKTVSHDWIKTYLVTVFSRKNDNVSSAARELHSSIYYKN